MIVRLLLGLVGTCTRNWKVWSTLDWPWGKTPAFDELPTPIVAAVHGTCVEGPSVGHGRFHATQVMIDRVSLDVRHRLLAALCQAVPARLPVIEATDKDAVGLYTANDFVTTSLSGKYLVSNASACTWMRMPTAGENPTT